MTQKSESILASLFVGLEVFIDFSRDQLGRYSKSLPNEGNGGVIASNAKTQKIFNMRNIFLFGGTSIPQICAMISSFVSTETNFII